MPALGKYLSIATLLLSTFFVTAQTKQLGLITLGPDGRVVKFASGMQMVDAVPMPARDGHERYIAKDLNVFFVQITHFACADVLNVNGSRSWIIQESRRLGINSGDVPMYTVTTECFNTEGAELDYSGYDASVNGWYTPGGAPTSLEPFRQLGAYRSDSPDRDLDAWHYIMRLARDKVAETQERESQKRNSVAEEKVYKVGNGVTPPILIHSVDAKFSQQARNEHVSGTSVVSLVVDRFGIPEDIRIVRPLGYGLDDNSIAAVKQYRFKPSTYKGIPVPVEVTIEVNYHYLDSHTGGR